MPPRDKKGDEEDVRHTGGIQGGQRKALCCSILKRPFSKKDQTTQHNLTPNKHSILKNTNTLQLWTSNPTFPHITVTPPPPTGFVFLLSSVCVSLAQAIECTHPTLPGPSQLKRWGLCISHPCGQEGTLSPQREEGLAEKETRRFMR